MFSHSHVILRGSHLINALVKLSQGYFTRLDIEFKICSKFYQWIYRTNTPEDDI